MESVSPKRNCEIWLGINSNPEMQAIGNDYWVNNGSKLLAELPVTTPQVINTWQRTVSETPDGTADRKSVV